MTKPLFKPSILEDIEISCSDIDKKIEKIEQEFDFLDKSSTILDFGCADGMISKAIIDKFGCKVVGVDISPKARELAQKNNPKNFVVLSPKKLQQEVIKGLRFDIALVLDVIDYSPSPIVDLSLIRASLKQGAKLYISLLENNRVPTNEGFLDFDTKKRDAISFLFTKQSEDIYSKKRLVLPIEATISVQDAIKEFQSGNLKKAEAIYKRVIDIYPYYSELKNSLGVVSKALKKFDQAAKLYKGALLLDPIDSKIYSNCSNLFKDMGKLRSALLLIQTAIRCDSQNPNLFNSMAIIYEKLKDFKNAQINYKKAIDLNPKFSKAINNLAVLYYNKKEYDKAIEYFDKALEVDPTYYEVYSNIGATYNKIKDFDSAIKNLELAIEYSPKNAGAYTNLGNVYNKLHRYKKAISLHKKSIELDPDGSNAYSNLANSHKSLGHFNKAIDNYKKALELNPDFINAKFDLATTYLHIKEFLDGFKEYESRFLKEEMQSHLVKHRAIFKRPLLTKKSDAKGKKVLIHSEQGFGDSILFARFIPLIKREFECEVILQCRDELKSLFENSICNVDTFYKRDSQPLPEFDFQIAMLSIPYLLQTSSVDDIPNRDSSYLNSSEKFELQSSKKIKIGICWGASVTGESFEGKVFELSEFDGVINSSKIEVYSLQVGEKSEDIKRYGYEDSIVDLTNQLEDFNKTAALINELDLVISSDTSVAHLAGALGAKVWIPLQKMPDWRWESRTKESYWYKSATLFRQKSFNKWDSVFQSIYDKLNRTYKLKLKYR
jgi:tetratricopeptide (TPR) repeat protein